jgi:hypothetical protein
MTNAFVPTKGYALLIAVNESEDAELALPAVANDVEALHKVLIHPERCGYAADNVMRISGADATRDGISNGLRWLREKIQADADVTAIVYYSGHGALESSEGQSAYYLLPYNVDRQDIQGTGLPAKSFADSISQMNSKRLFVVLDCCHAQGMAVKDASTWLPGYVQSPPPLDVFKVKADDGEVVTPSKGAKGLEGLERGLGRAVLSSCRAKQLSYVYGDKHMSAFTYHLIEALTGHFNPQEGATDIRVYDVINYVDHVVPLAVQTKLRQVQQPDFTANGSFAIAQLLGGKGWSKGMTAPDPLENAVPASRPPVGPGINTGGGAYISGNVKVGGNFAGRDQINTGDHIQVGNVGSGSAVATGRGARVDVDDTTSIQTVQILQHLAPLVQAAQTAQPEKRAAATQTATELVAEASKGNHADDSRMAHLLDKFVELVPGAVATVASTFASPLLSGIAGPVTKFLLDKLQQK